MRKMLLVFAAAMLLCPAIAHPAQVKTFKRIPTSAIRPEYDVRFGRRADDFVSASRTLGQPSVQSYSKAVQAEISPEATAPPPSPGITIKETSYDAQHDFSSGYQVARTPGADIVHFSWMAWERIPANIDDMDRNVGYNSYTISTSTFNQGFGDPFLGLTVQSRAGYTSIAVGDDNKVRVAFQQREDPAGADSPWQLFYPIPGNILHIDDELSGYESAGCSNVIWPQLAVQQRAGANDYSHEIAHDASCGTERVWYWRHNGTVWQGPVLIDSNFQIGYVMAADKSSDRVAIVMHTDREPQFGGLLNIAYYESNNAGQGWLDGSELGDAHKHIITNYTDPNGPQAWGHISSAYDNTGVLHIVWDEQRFANQTADDAIRHWSSATSATRTVALGYWPSNYNTGALNLKLAKVTLGIGDGGTTCGGQSNDNFLYVLYTRFGGPTPTEEADHSALGYYNGELYLNVSKDGGNSWSPPRNLTNTKTPNCNPGHADTITGQPQNPSNVCRSEHWATIGMAVSDIDIFFISDLDAGGIPQGEGTWQMNPVMYYRIPGGTANAPIVCPIDGPQYASSLAIDSDACGIQSSFGVPASGNLTVTNYGNLALTGSVSVVYTNPTSPAAQWLSVNGVQTLPISIAVGGPDLNVSIAMSALDLPRGTYQAEIHVAHNDTTQGGLQVIPITFSVSPCACHANPVCDGAINVQDVVAVIARAFRSAGETLDASCPDSPPAIDGATDVDCTGATDIVDVVKMIDVAFRGANPEVKFCSPCSL